MEANGSVNDAAVVETAEAPSVSKEVVEAIHLMAQGKRNMMCQEISPAVQQFQEACEILGRTYGEVGDECADAYYWYGKALLELSRIEGGVIGDSVPTESEESQSENENSEEQKATNEDGASATDDDEANGSVLSEDIEDEEADIESKAVKENETVSETVTETSSETKEVTRKDDAAVSSEINKQINGGTVTDKQEEANGGESSSNLVPSTSKSAEQNQSEEDDVSNLQLAWEMMELAKLIYSRHNTRDMKLKLADTYLKLGEIGMETEQFDQSITDLTQSLALLKSNLAPEDRHIAETLYQLGLACQLDKRYDDAVQHFEESIRCLESRVMLQKGIVSGEIQPEIASETSDGFYSPQELAAKEIEEINEIIPDIRSKIEDVVDEKRCEARVRVMMDSLNQPSSSALSSFTAGAASSSSTAITSSPAKPSLAAERLGGPTYCQPETSFGFSEVKPVPVNNIMHLVRKKRKDDSENECPEVKRACTQTNGETSAAELNGTAQISTGSHTNQELSKEEIEK